MDVLSSFFHSLKSKPDVSCGHNLAYFLKDRTRSCPHCGCLQQEHAAREWPGLPAGLKFEPSDEELIRHLRDKLRVENCVPHPLLDDFIPTLEAGQDICYTHPEKLPGILRDGSKRYFFHRHAKAYKNGNRKRRRIEDNYECRWHKTGKSRRVVVDGKQLGFKKILVLYKNVSENKKLRKTNWVIYQYHLGEDENEKEKDDELVVSKIFYKIHNSTALSNSASKEAVAETSEFKTFATENSAIEQEIARICNSNSLGTTNSENSSRLCELAGSDATSKRAIKTSANTLVTLNGEIDDYSVFRGIEQNSTFVDEGCSLRSEGKEAAEWPQLYFWHESPSESFHTMNSSSISFNSFRI